MVDFIYHNPTKIVFGKDKENQIGQEIANVTVKKVLLCYGSERVKTDGLYQRVTDSLSKAGIIWVDLGGIVSNPKLSKVHEGIALAKQEHVDAILALGGGSVLDSAKTIAVGALCDHDVWDYFIGKATIKKALPIFDVMTLAATGSEMNGFAVISNDTTQQKYSIHSEHIYPRVSILNPELTKSVPHNYLAYSAVDIIAHVIEGYFTAITQPHFQSRMVEGIVKTVMESTEILLKDPQNYEARAEFMWAATQALNGSTTAGTNPSGFPNHLIEHSLSALFNIAHGAGLAIVIPAWMQWYKAKNHAQFERFSQEIFGISNVDESISHLKGWFEKIGAPVSLEAASISKADIPSIAKNAAQTAVVWGMNVLYTEQSIAEILHHA